MTIKPRSACLFLCAALLLGGCAGAPMTARVAPGAAYPHDADTALRAAMRVVGVAREMLGVRYSYGGESPAGFDCSGLVYYSYQETGLGVPRTTRAQYQATRPVSARELEPGDLVFFRLDGRAVSHVGLYIGDGRFIHAPATGKEVTVTSLTHRYWRERFVRGGRFG